MASPQKTNRFSISCFLLVPEGQHVDVLVFRFVTIQGDITGIAEADQELSQRGSIRKRATDFRGRLKCRELFGDRFTGAPCRRSIVSGEKLPATFQSPGCAFGDDYLRHFGTLASRSVPQVFNHDLTSLPVRCRPVSWKAFQDAIAS